MIPVSVLVGKKATVSAKIKGHYDKYNPPKFSSFLRPIVFWNITYKCNLECLHCYINAGPFRREDEELPSSKIIEIAKEMIEMKIPLIIFSGGEPLARKDFFEIIKVFRNSQKPKLALSTNGTLITEDVAKRLKENGFSYVGISIDSTNPQEHDTFRGSKGAFNAAIRGIKNSIKLGLDVGIRTTITKYNIDEVSEIIKYASKLGIKRVSLYLLDTTGRGTEISEWLPTHQQMIKMCKSLIDNARKYEDLEILLVRMNFAGIYIVHLTSNTKEEFLKGLELLGSQGDCGRKTISIYPDGRVMPCQFINYLTIGDLKKQNLKSVLNPANEALRPFMKIQDYLRGEKCSKCAFKVICGGGSRSRALALTGDPWGDDPACFINPHEISFKWNFYGN